MSLKGYQWFRDKKIIMSYYFKDEKIYLWNDVTIQEYHAFMKFLKEQKCNCNEINCNWHTIIFEEDQ